MPSLICTICWPKISEPELGQSQHQEIGLAYELTNENVSYFLTNQSKTKTFIDLKVTRKPKPTKNSTRPYVNEIPAHFTLEIKTKGYDIIGVKVFLRKLMKFLRNKVE